MHWCLCCDFIFCIFIFNEFWKRYAGVYAVCRPRVGARPWIMFTVLNLNLANGLRTHLSFLISLTNIHKLVASANMNHPHFLSSFHFCLSSHLHFKWHVWFQTEEASEVFVPVFILPVHMYLWCICWRSISLINKLIWTYFPEQFSFHLPVPSSCFLISSLCWLQIGSLLLPKSFAFPHPRPTHDMFGMLNQQSWSTCLTRKYILDDPWPCWYNGVLS